MPRLYAENPLKLFGALQSLQDIRRHRRPAERHVDVRAQELDVVLDRLGHLAVDPLQRLQRVVRLTFLKVDARQPKGGFVAHALLDVALEHRLDGAPGALVHAVVELEVADRKFRLLDVIVERIELRLVDAAVLGELGVEPLQRLEVVALIGVIERLSEIEVLQVGSRRRARGQQGGQRQSKSSRAARDALVPVSDVDRGLAGIRAGQRHTDELGPDVLAEGEAFRLREVLAAASLPSTRPRARALRWRRCRCRSAARRPFCRASSSLKL